MKAKVSLYLPRYPHSRGEPCIIPKARPRFSRGKHAFTPKGYRGWLEWAIPLLADASTLTSEDWEYPLSVEILFRGYTRADLDNAAGAVLDALVKAEVVEDDSLKYISSLKLRYFPRDKKDRSREGVYIVISPDVLSADK